MDIPSSVSVIEGYAFAGCKSLKQIKLGIGLKQIKTFAFFGTPLSEVQCMAVNPPVFEKPYGDLDFWFVFDSRPGNSTLYVADSDCAALYEKSDWARFFKIVPLNSKK